MRLQQTLEKYLPLIGGMLVPAAVFAYGLFAFLYDENFSEHTKMLFHVGFYLLGLINFIVLLNFNLSRPLFFMITCICGYIFINYLKNRYDADFTESVWYQNLTVFLPANLVVFYLCSGKKFLSRYSLTAVLFLMAEYTAVEFLGRAGWTPCFVWHGINILSSMLFTAVFLSALVNAVKTGSLYDYTILFAVCCIAAGVYYSAFSSAVSLFFFMAQLFLSVYLGYTLIYNHYYDELTGFYSRNSYLMQAKNFPLKYSLGLVCIDSFDKLSETIGRKKADTVVGMIASVLESEVQEENIYRYAADQFIIIYKKLDKKETFARLENIRRTIAGLNFEYSPAQRPLKLTVSCSVSEKKRSDAGAVEVLMRADKAMRKTLKFSHNVTSQG